MVYSACTVPLGGHDKEKSEIRGIRMLASLPFCLKLNVGVKLIILKDDCLQKSPLDL